LFGVGVAVSDEAGSAHSLRRHDWIEAEKPVAAGFQEILVDGDRIDLGASDLVVAGIVSDIDLIEDAIGGVEAATNVLARKIAQVVVVGLQGPEHVVPDNLARNVGIVGIEKGKRLTGDIVDNGAAVR